MNEILFAPLTFREFFCTFGTDGSMGILNCLQHLLGNLQRFINIFFGMRIAYRTLLAGNGNMIDASLDQGLAIAYIEVKILMV
jgi:hypothetical protein